jgi:hypothetical protein
MATQNMQKLQHAAGKTDQMCGGYFEKRTQFVFGTTRDRSPYQYDRQTDLLAAPYTFWKERDGDRRPTDD